ncbi:hypothetical protein [Limnobaculum xujianqingii]|uniref:hypothetical protein n=1 Tax=Limnobaculum xujianqingii TaxID=2738837 RepID=UPI00112D79F7|nr:hypothetical protein [Limnobaculum xujianqingii]
MRELFFKILDYKGNNLFKDELIPWLKENENYYSNFMKQVSELTADIDNISLIPDEVSWELYALSRVLDCLTEKFQYKEDISFDKSAIPLSQAQYIYFAQRLGLTATESKVFSTFYCEIIRAECSESNFDILDTRYPALMLGHLLIHRGGVIISMSPSMFNLELVNNAEIYWAYLRAHRESHDLSKGWGSNSQWRTRFRFDFECPDGFLYNAQGDVDLNQKSDAAFERLKEYDLSLAEAEELTMYRHFITCTKKGGDVFPYDYKFFDEVGVLDDPLRHKTAT